MGCLSHRKKQIHEVSDQKWEYINLNDFKSKGCGRIFAYIYLWIMLIISIAVYAVDSFTAVNLLIFNRWNSKIQPAIPFLIQKWIFSVCILLSFVNLGYEAWRAYRVMKRGNVAECYLDSLAVRWESIRLGSGQGFRRFLVFAELTTSKKGAEYIALFTYFSFQSWIRVIICSGPRSVLNALMIKSVYEAKLVVNSDSVGGSFTMFFSKIKSLADEDYRQAVVLSGMCFTLVIWVFSALFLITAALFWLFFLWHWIPKADGGLSGYCERRVTKALLKIVTQKVNKALAKGEQDRLRYQAKAAQKALQAGEKPPLSRVTTATLPTLPNLGPVSEDKLPDMPTLPRSETMATLPAYTSRPATPGGMEMGVLDQKRHRLSRSGTEVSTTSYSSKAPLMSAASDMGTSEPRRPPPSGYGPNRAYSDVGYDRPGPPSQAGRHPPPQRSFTSTSQSNYGPPSNPPYHPPALFPGGGHVDAASVVDEYAAMDHHSTVNSYSQPMPYPPPRAQTSTPGPRRYDSYDTYGQDGRASPAPTNNSYWNAQPPPRSATAAPMPPRGPPYPPQRNATAPMAPMRPYEDNFARSNTPGMRASPAPWMGPSAGGQGPPTHNYDAGYDAGSQNGHGYY